MNRRFLGGLAIGAIIGAIIALLFAPRKGEETRAKLKDGFDDLRRRMGGKTTL